MALHDSMDYLKNSARGNHRQRERTLDEMIVMFDYMVHDHMEQLHAYSRGAIPKSNHETTIESLLGCSVSFIRALNSQIMLADNDQAEYTRRGDAIEKWTN